MNKVYISLASILLLQGCDSERPPSDDEILKYIDQRAAELNQKQLNSESAELEQIKKQLQEKDPSVTDVYYTYDGEQKQLHVVSSKGETEETSNFVWPLVGGLAAGYLVGQMLSAGSVSNYASHNPPARYNSYPSAAHWRRKADEDKRHYSGYTYTYMQNQMRNNPQVRSAASKVIISTRSQGILNNASRANSGATANPSTTASRSAVSQPVSSTTRSNGIFSAGSTGARAASTSSANGG